MKQPSPTTVLLLLAVVAVVAMYVLGVGLGATDRSRERPGLAVSAEQRQAWRERLVRPREVREDELRLEPASGCELEGRELRVHLGARCEVEVASSGTRVRTLEVAPQAGSQLAMDFTPKSQPALPVSEDALTRPHEADVLQEGARLALRCERPSAGTSPPACRVQLR